MDAAGLNRFTCVKSRMEDYASELKTNRVGDGNAKNFDEFIKGKDRYGNPVKVKKILSNILQPWLSANQQNPFLVETYFTVLKISPFWHRRLSLRSCVR